MSSVNPLERNDRQQDLIATSAGQVLFGPSDFKIYDVLDVAVFKRLPNTDDWIRLDADAFTVALTDPAPAYFTVTLATGVAIDTGVRLSGARLAERSTDVTQGGAIKAALLETELDKHTVVMQELRRDVDAAIRPDALDVAVGAAVAAATERAEAAASQAEEIAAGVDDQLESVINTANATLAQANTAVTQANLAKSDAQAAAVQTTSDRSQTGGDVATCTGLVAAAAGYAAALANPDYGLITDSPTGTTDYGSIA